MGYFLMAGREPGHGPDRACRHATVPAMQSSTAAIAAAAAVNGVQAAARSPAASAATVVAGPRRQAAPRMAEPVRRLALVTGAAQRLGRAIALALARDGWDIGVHYATSEGEARQTANDIRALGRQ